MDNSVVKYKDLIGADDTFDVIFANINKLRKELKSLTKDADKAVSSLNPNDEKAMEDAIKNVRELSKAKKRLDEEEKAAIKTKKKLNELTEEELILREQERIANRERRQIAKQNAILLKAEAGSIEALRAELSLVTLEWKKLSAAERENGKEGKSLVKEKKRLTDQLKALEKQTGDTRRNVGNYTDSLGKLGRTAARIFIGRSIVDGIKRIGSALVSITQDGAGVSKELGEIQKAGNRFVNILTGAAARLLETFGPAITKIINSFSFVIEKIGETANQTGFLGESFRFVGDVISGVIDIFANIPAIFGGISAAGLQLASNIQDSFTKLGIRLQILFENIESANPFSDRSADEIQRNIERLRGQINRINGEQVGVIEAFKSGFEAVKQEQEEFEKKQGDLEKLGARIRNNEEARTNELEKQNQLLEQQNQLSSTRLQAIEEIQKQITEAEIGNIEDRQEQLFRLEEKRIAEENKLRDNAFNDFVSSLEEQEKILIDIYGNNADEVIAFRSKATEELREFEALQLKLEEEQLAASEKRKLEIRKQFQLEAIKVSAISQDEGFEDALKADLKAATDQINEFQAEQDKKEADRIAMSKKRNEELLQGIEETSNKIAEQIVKVYEKQAELAGELVESQAEAVETQRERAEQGLNNTLKFEQEQLAKREAERIRAEQRATQAAKLLSLFNLVSAYAANGDENALARALIDFGLLEAFSNGFSEGGYTGDVALNAVAGHVHGQEFVVNAKDTAKYNLTGKKGHEFGEAISDYYKHTSPVLNDTFGEHKSDLESITKQTTVNIDLSDLKSEIVRLRKAYESQPTQEFDILQMTDYFVELAKRVTTNQITKKEKKRISLK